MWLWGSQSSYLSSRGQFATKRGGNEEKRRIEKKERENLEELDHHSVCDGSTPWTTNEHPALL